MRCKIFFFSVLCLGIPTVWAITACAAPHTNSSLPHAAGQNASSPAAEKNATSPATEKSTTTPAAEKNATSPAPKHTAGVGKTTQNATAEKTSPTTGKDGWVVMEQGTRPVYVGIHGGTVPLTVLRASNGTLFALAGETGTDFMNVLQGNTTVAGRGNQHTPTHNASALAPLTQENATAPAAIAEQAPANATTHEPQQNATVQNAVPTTAPKEAEEKKETAAPPASPVLEQKETGKLPASGNAQTLPVAPVGNGTDPKKAVAGKNSPAPAEQTPPPAPTPVQVPVQAPAQPADTQNLVFASSDLANKLKHGKAELSPFGLSGTDEANQDEAEHTTSPLPASTKPLPRLKLGSYKKMLNL